MSIGRVAFCAISLASCVAGCASQSTRPCNQISLSADAVRIISLSILDKKGYRFDKDAAEVGFIRTECDYLVNVTYDQKKPGRHVWLTLTEAGELKQLDSGY